jgi:hypothetical protein
VVNVGRRVILTTLLPSVRHLSRKCGNPAVSQRYGPSWPVTGIALLYLFNFYYYYSGSGAHPASYPMVTRDSSPRIKRQGREADLSPPTSAEVKEMWFYTSTPLYAFMA